MAKGKILFCHTGRSSFVNTDFNILESGFEIIEYQYIPSGNWIGKLRNLIHSIFITIKYVPRIDIVYSFFVGFHCFFPFILGKLLKKKTIVAIGGYDAVSVPSIKYGIFYKQNLLTFCTKIVYNIADFLLPVHKSLIKSENEYLAQVDKNAKIGFAHFVPQVKGKIIEVPTGYDPEIFITNKSIVRKASVLSVASIENDQDIKRKGFDLILKIAEKMKTTEFMLVGFSSQMLEHFINKGIPKNVKLVGFQERGNLVNLYSAHKIYLQLSLAEGLPNALCEAMLCECIPVGTSVCGIPDAIREVGYILTSDNISDAVHIIEKALDQNSSSGAYARQRIINEFSLSRREKKIINIFNLCLNI